MSLTGKYVSLKYIIAKVYQDLGLQDEESLFIDAVEWASQALDFIGVYDQYESDTACVEVTNYKGELPCNFIALEGIDYNGQSMTPNNGVFGPNSTTADLLYLEPRSYDQKFFSSPLQVQSKYIFTTGESIKIENGWLKTSFQEGLVYIKYTSQPYDCDNFPLVPDHPSFIEALYWFINMKYSYILWRRDELSERFYRDAETKWHWYCNQAGAEAMKPDLMTLENIKRSYTALKPNLHNFSTFFNNL